MSTDPNETVNLALESWKKTVDVQQHFNTIEMQIRNLGVTVVTAAIAAAAVLHSRPAPSPAGVTGDTANSWASGMIVFGALVAWLAFYFMDRWWYHRFLTAAGREAARLEELVANSGHGDVLRLSRAIGEASPITLRGKKIRSDQKIDLFYALVGLLIAIAMLAFFIS